MRIVGGRLRSRALATPRNQAIRPTSDRVREALFNILASRLLSLEDPVAPLQGHRVLDIFAGTGALGLEALSRGAGFCLFMETDASARGLILENCERLGLLRQTQVYRRDATTPGQRPRKLAPFSLLFADPPYGQALAERAVAALAKGQWLADEALLVIEERKDVELTLPADFQPIDRRQYGQTAVHFFQRRPTLAQQENT